MVVDTTAPSGVTVCTASYCTKADATLYAAAPELLEALKAIIDAVHGQPGEETCQKDDFSAARSAIAKAEG